jgi:sulfur-oxidizing protein SoxY
LSAGGLAGCAAFAGVHGEAGATPAALQEAMRKVTGGVAARKGRVRLDLPPLVDNGNAVPISVAVESPMTAAEHVKAIHVFTEKNPLPNVVSAWLTPRSGEARFTTRVRLADTQTVTALAELSDGSFWLAEQSVVVTLAACVEELP